MIPPDHTERLFAHFAEMPAVDGSDWPVVVERLLEDGDRRDLRWLTATVPEERLGDWLDGRATRRLSRRSRAFWSIVLGAEIGTPAPVADALWPF